MAQGGALQRGLPEGGAPAGREGWLAEEADIQPQICTFQENHRRSRVFFTEDLFILQVTELRGLS